MSISGQLVTADDGLPQLTANEFFIAKRTAEALHKAYPGHLWAVSVEGPFVDVRNLYLSGEWGFRCSLREYYSSSDWDKKIVRAGGEILERYRQRRGVAVESDIHELPTDFSGRHKPEM